MVNHCLGKIGEDCLTMQEAKMHLTFGERERCIPTLFMITDRPRPGYIRSRKLFSAYHSRFFAITVKFKEGYRLGKDYTISNF